MRISDGSSDVCSSDLQRPRRLRPLPPVTALDGRDRRVHARRVRHGSRDARAGGVVAMRWIIALFAGALFGAGLAVSGMAEPTRVRAFLDLPGGARDPTLAIVIDGVAIPRAVPWVVL